MTPPAPPSHKREVGHEPCSGHYLQPVPFVEALGLAPFRNRTRRNLQVPKMQTYGVATMSLAAELRALASAADLDEPPCRERGEARAELIMKLLCHLPTIIAALEAQEKSA